MARNGPRDIKLFGATLQTIYDEKGITFPMKYILEMSILSACNCSSFG